MAKRVELDRREVGRIAGRRRERRAAGRTGRSRRLSESGERGSARKDPEGVGLRVTSGVLVGKAPGGA